MAEHQWYIANTPSGKEEMAKKAVDKRIEADRIKDISECIVPKYKEIIYKDGKKRTVEKKSFPGYVYIKMNMNKDSMRYILETPYIYQFVASEKDAEPRPLTEKETQGLMPGEEASSVDIGVHIDFDVGQKVLIIDGPFNNFSGTIKAIYPDKRKVCVNVEIFGRITPVEIDYFKVKKN